MALIFTSASFAGLDNLHILEQFNSQIDFAQQEWRFTLLTNEENDVEISYLFQFDQVDNNIEVFCNGLDEDILRYDILSLLASHMHDLTFTLD